MGVFKVKAHVEEYRGLSDLERFWKLGNDLADSVAKNSLARHPQPDPCDVIWLDRCLSIAKCVMRLSAELMPLWPKLDLKGVPLALKPPKPKVDPQPHRWVRSSWPRQARRPRPTAPRQVLQRFQARGGGPPCPPA
eukprot:1403490-Pyramimonas_sp.AAC.1